MKLGNQLLHINSFFVSIKENFINTQMQVHRQIQKIWIMATENYIA